MKQFRTTLVFFFAVLSFPGYSQADSFSIYFATGKTELDRQHIAAIDSILYAGKISGNVIVNITGYADEPGTSMLNNSIAKQRAASVQTYLLSSGIDKKQLGSCTGMGNLLRTGNDVHQRRADLIITKADNIRPADHVLRESAAKESDSGLRALATMKPDDVIVLKNLLFRVSSSVILEQSLPTLNELVSVLKAAPLLKIRLEGHICCGTVSDPKYWLSLSEDRAKAVMDYLATHGIAEDRLSSKGLGFTKPKVYPERTEADQFLNRRVEIRVMSNK